MSESDLSAEAAAMPWRPAPDLGAEITRGLLWAGPARKVLMGETAAAAAAQLTDLRIGPFPVEFLAYCVRSMGLAQARDLAEPLPGEAAARLARDWLAAAAEAGTGLIGADLFATWLVRVAKMVAARRSATVEGA